jgi:hypothetical protein
MPAGDFEIAGKPDSFSRLGTVPGTEFVMRRKTLKVKAVQ